MFLIVYQFLMQGVYCFMEIVKVKVLLKFIMGFLLPIFIKLVLPIPHPRISPLLPPILQGETQGHHHLLLLFPLLLHPPVLPHQAHLLQVQHHLHLQQ